MPSLAFTGGSDIKTGKCVYVDATNGNDTSGARGKLGKPFLTINAAKAAAQSGDLVVVFPGTYTAGSIDKDGVNWFGYKGAFLSVTSDSTGSTGGRRYLIGDAPAGVSTASTFSVTGNFQFLNQDNVTGAVQIYGIYQGNAGSFITVQCDKIDAEEIQGGGFYSITIFGSASALAVRAVEVRGTSGPSVKCTGGTIDLDVAYRIRSFLNDSQAPTLWATGGTIRARTNFLDANASAIKTNGGTVRVYANEVGSGAEIITGDTGNVQINCNYITSNGIPVYLRNGAAQTVNIYCNVIESAGVAVRTEATGCSLYITANQIIGGVDADQNTICVINGATITGNRATALCQSYSNSFTSTLIFNSCRIVNSHATAACIDITGNSSKNNVVLNGCVLFAQSGASVSVSAAAAENLNVVSAVANKALSVNITTVGNAVAIAAGFP